MSEREILINIAERLGYEYYQEGSYLEIYGDSCEPISIEFSSNGEVASLY